MRKIIFLGNPNVGKSALINSISGSKIKVGNWAGVTVDRIEAKYKFEGEEYQLIDLPGTYHLGNEGREESITTKVLLEQDYDLIVNVVDATNLERNLYLTLLARELQKPMILVLNYDDEVKKHGTLFNTEILERYLQMPVVCTSATKSTGIAELRTLLKDFPYDEKVNYNIYYSQELDELAIQIYNVLKQNKKTVNQDNLTYLTYRLMEEDAKARILVDKDTLVVVDSLIEQYQGENDADESMRSILQLTRYEQLNKVLQEVIDTDGVSRYRFTKRLDSIVLNKWLGLPLFILFAIYFLSLIFNVANPLNDWLGDFVTNYLGHHLANLLKPTPAWFQSMMVDGILEGFAGVLKFTPLMYFIYLMMGILEETGLMSRIAFIMDRLMKGLGLDGRAFISMILGFGCTVPAITSTRTLGDERSRKITTLMLPFMSCGARLPVYALFGATFFGKDIGLVIASLYLLGILVAIIVGLVLRAFKAFDTDVQNDFVIEMPPYRLPEPKILFKNVHNRVKGFITRVISVIMIVIFAVWAFNYFPNGKPSDSYLTRATQVVQPLFEPAGFGESKVAVAAIPTSIAAKEAVVSTIQQLQSVDLNEKPEGTTFNEQMQSLGSAVVESIEGLNPLKVIDLFSPDTEEVDQGDTITKTRAMFTGANAKLKAYAYMVYILLLVPCIVALATVKKEFGIKFMLQVLLLTLIVPYIVSIIIFQLGNMLFY